MSAEPAQSSTAPDDVSPPSPTSSGSGQAAVAVGTSTPLRLDSEGNPVSWLGKDAPDPAHRLPVTIALAQKNYPEDLSISSVFPFTAPLPSGFVPLLTAAEHVWESVANVQFIAVSDSPTLAGAPDVRIGLANLTPHTTSTGRGPLLGAEYQKWSTQTDKFDPDNLIQIQDPAEKPVTPLGSGDLRYQGTTITAFRELIHELGHALGLANSPKDPNSVMNPDLTGAVPDANDIASARLLYGPAPGAPTLSATDIAELNKLGVPVLPPGT